MSDAYQRLRSEVKLTLNQDDPLTMDIVTLLADRDALAERCEELWEALRDVAISAEGGLVTATISRCRCCNQRWGVQEPERHTPGCLAAPKEAT